VRLFKVRWFLDVSNSTRRLLWTLAHAHGTLLGLVHIAFAVTLPALPGEAVRAQRIASLGLTAATVLLPGGFFLGGTFIYGGDPGLGILLVPLGALALLAGVLATACAATTTWRSPRPREPGPRAPAGARDRKASGS